MTGLTGMNRTRNHLDIRRRSEERRQREDDTVRVLDKVPLLVSLRFEIENGDTKYGWPIIIERAPALFEVACDEHACQEGGHDLTHEILRSLLASSTSLEGQDARRGQVRGSECRHILRYVGAATYR
ncbi:MAG: hypothetical protein EXR72_25035 [Myxococcales bacterium]|nr:hypothetical protein [Myxococcales bacterium]